jgi:hypothetical protein
MRVYIFKGPAADDYGFTGDQAGGNLPAEKGPWQPFREIDMVRGKPRIGVSTEEVLDAIEKGNSYVTSVRIQITENELGSAEPPPGPTKTSR